MSERGEIRYARWQGAPIPRRRRVLAALAGGIVLLQWSPVFADDTTRPRSGPPSTSAAPGLRVYIDPHTGRPGTPPTSGPLPDETQPRAALPVLPREVQNAGPAGGYMLNTRALTYDVGAAVGPQGGSSVECHPRAARSAGK